GGRADAAADRRADRAVAQQDLEVLDLRLVRLDGASEGADLGFGVVEIEDWGRPLGYEVGVTPHVALGALKLGLVAREITFSLLDLRVDRAAVETHQHIALSNHRAVGEFNRRDFAVDARTHRHTRDRRHVADRTQGDRVFLFDGFDDLDRDRTRSLIGRLGRGASGKPERG